MPHYLFWASIILTILLILALLIVLFYPRTYVDFVLSTHGGKLTLKRSAIEGLVREKIIEYEFLKILTLILLSTKQNSCWYQGRNRP